MPVHLQEILLGAPIFGLLAQFVEFGVDVVRPDVATEQAHEDVRPRRRAVREEPGREGLHDQDAFLRPHAGGCHVGRERVGLFGHVGDFQTVRDDGVFGGALEHERSAAEVWHCLKSGAVGFHLGIFVDEPIFS